MGKSSRQRRAGPNAPNTKPARTSAVAEDHDSALAARIATGGLDAELPALIDAINDRLRTIDDQRTRDARGRLHLHDRVRLNDNVNPRYLIGQTGEIHEINDDYIVVHLDRPVGRFTNGHIRCAPTGLDPLHPSGT